MTIGLDRAPSGGAGGKGEAPRDSALWVHTDVLFYLQGVLDAMVVPAP